MENKTESANRTVNKYYANKKRRKKKKKVAFYTLLVVFFVAVVTVLSLTVFFNISEITITGNSHYTADEIRTVSGLAEGQNLFRLNKFKLIAGMKKQLPYLSDITVKRHLPVGIEIIVTETSATMYVQTETECIVLDPTLKVLEKVATPPEGTAPVSGITPVSAEVGSVMTAADGADSNLLSLSAALAENFPDGGITAITVGQAYNINFCYSDRITVMLGTLEGVENKMQLVKYVIDENKSNEHAEIDVSSGTRAYYRSTE